MANDFIRVPPDSTGKRVRNERVLDVIVSNVDGDVLNSIQIGDEITASSGGTGYYTGYKIDSRNTIIIFLRDHLGNFSTGSTLTHQHISGNQIFATVTEATETYTQRNIISDRNNPDNALKIDNSGAGYVRFSEGNATLDVFGNLKTTTSTILKSYLFYNGRNPGDFVDTVQTGGTVTEDHASSQVVIGTTSASGSRSVMTTWNYIPYVPQKSNTIVLSIACGDEGKEGVVRRWGMYDDDDGLYFEQTVNGLTANIRSSITGTVVSIPQSQFNGDNLLSDTFDTFELNTSKYNLYWISYQWQGVGIARYGVYSPQGARITMHTFENPNKNVVPYMKRGTLPVRMEQFNTSVVASASEMKTPCIVVLRDSPEFETVGKIQRYTTPQYITVTSDRTPLISLRVSNTVNGVPNRTVIIPFMFEYITESSPVVIEYIVNGELSGSNFQTYTQYSEMDTTSTGIIGGFSSGATINPVGYHREIAPDSLEHAVNNTDTQTHVTIVARTTKPDTTASVFLIAKWKEVI